MSLFSVVITSYDEYDEIVLKTDPAQALAELLAGFGVAVSEDNERNTGRLTHDQLADLMRRWLPDSAEGSVIYWLGHGRDNGRTPVLLHSASRRQEEYDAVQATGIFDHLRRIARESSCLVLIIEACKSEGFAKKLSHLIDEDETFDGPVLIVHAAGEITTPGRANAALKTVLYRTFATEEHIPLARLAGELEFVKSTTGVGVRMANLSNAALHRQTLPPIGLTAEMHPRILELIERLGPDERRYLIPKAQSGELGEMAWYFEGRDEERGKILDWLKSDDRLCVVTGAAGAGKSALLGDIVIRCHRVLAQTLSQARLMPPVEGWEDFECETTSISVSGLTTMELVERLLEDLDLKACGDGWGTSRAAAHLEAEIAAASPDRLLVIDGLDEMETPLEAARVLRRISRIEGMKLIIGTRQLPSLGGRFFPFLDQDILLALGVSEPDGAPTLVRLGMEQAAVTRYVERRLAPLDIDHKLVAESVSAASEGFLQASMIIHELLSDPTWADPYLLSELLASDLNGLFEVMIDRLKRIDSMYPVFLKLAALSQGRGAPLLDSVWARMAHVIIGEAGDDVSSDRVTQFVEDAAVYLRVDRDLGQTVYRPAHSLLSDFLVGDHLEEAQGLHALLAEFCAEQALLEDSPNPYFINYATSHARAAGPQGWWTIDRVDPRVWRYLDSQRVMEDAMQSLFGAVKMPEGVADIVSSHHARASLDGRDNSDFFWQWASATRVGRFTGDSGTVRRAVEAGEVRLLWAKGLRRQPTSLSLIGHRSRVTAVHGARVGPNRAGIVSGSSQGEVFLWDQQSGGLLARFLGLGSVEVTSVASLSASEGGLLIFASTLTGMAACWSAGSGEEMWKELVAEDAVLAVAGWCSSDGERLLLVLSRSGVTSIRCAESGTLIDQTSQHLPSATCLTVREAEDSSTFVAVGDEDGTVVVHALERDTYGDWGLRWISERKVVGPVLDLAFLASADTSVRILTSQGQVLDWSISKPITSSVSPPSDLRSHRGALGRVAPPGLLETHEAEDGCLSFSVTDGSQLTRHGTASHSGGITALTTTSFPPDRALLVSGGSDRIVRIWDPLSSGAASAKHRDPLSLAMLLSSGRGVASLAVTADYRGRIELLSPGDARSVAQFSTSSKVAGMAASVDLHQQSLIMVAALDGTVHLWRQNGNRKPRKIPFGERFHGLVAVDVDGANSREWMAIAELGGAVSIWRMTGMGDPPILVCRWESGIAVPRSLKLTRCADGRIVVLVYDGSKVVSATMKPGRFEVIEEASLHGASSCSAFFKYPHGVAFVYGSQKGTFRAVPHLWREGSGLSSDSDSVVASMCMGEPITSVGVVGGEGADLCYFAAGENGLLCRSESRGLGPETRVNLGQRISGISCAPSGAVLVLVEGGAAGLLMR